MLNLQEYLSSIIVCGDFYQLPPIQQRPVYAEFSDPMLIIDHCWKSFKIAELTEVMRQRGDRIFISLLNNVRKGILTDEDAAIFESRFISEKNPVYPFNAVHIFAENNAISCCKITFFYSRSYIRKQNVRMILIAIGIIRS